jgi:D-sedoheptulose 7-phosphate isomerase
LDDRLTEISRYFDDTAALQLRAAAECGNQILRVVDLIAAGFRNGNKVLLCGNGGSAADCQHMAAEFTGKLTRQREALAAIALTTDTSILTGQSNDNGFETVFSRQVEALGRRGDVLIGISTSGRSENVKQAMRTARAREIKTVALVGSGGPLIEEVDEAVLIPDNNTQRIQEAMLPIEHLICLLVERSLFG